MGGTAVTGTRRLLGLLGDADPDVRFRAALELGEGRHVHAAAALVDRFGLERDFATRETLTWAVLRIQDVALPLVRDALASPRWLARLQAAHTLSKVGDRADGRRLIAVIADPIDAVAARAYGAAARSGDPVVIPALVAELSRGSSEHRNSLTVALSQFGADAVPALVGALRHGPVPAVRQHAADTLALLGSPAADRAVGALGRALRDGDGSVRLAALNALGQLALPAAWDRIDGLTTSPESRLRVLASRLIERRPSERVLRRAPPIVPIEDDESPRPSGSPERWPVPDLTLVSCAGGPQTAELAPKLALQVAICRPRYLTRADVPDEVLATVHAAALAEARANGEPAAAAERIAVGAVEQHVHETVLLEQVSVADPGALIRDLLFGTEVHVSDFARLDPPPDDDRR